MSLREQVVQQLDSLGEPELQQVATFLSCLRFQGRVAQVPKCDEQTMAKLYAEFADEDRQLAEMGIEDYASALRTEDTQ